MTRLVLISKNSKQELALGNQRRTRPLNPVLNDRGRTTEFQGSVVRIESPYDGFLALRFTA